MLWSCCTLALALGAGPNPNLDSARRLVGELRYPEAALLLAKAREQSGNDRSQLSEILWLQGLVAATVGKADEARVHFRALCSIDFEFVVPGEPAPKVMGPFFEAKGWAGTSGRLKFEALPPEVAGGKISAVAATVAADPLGLARRVRFHLQGSAAAWYTVDAPVDAPRAAIAWNPAELAYFVELLGEADAVLASLGSQSAPISVRSRGEEVVPPPPPPLVVASSRPFFGPLRILGSGAVGAALVLAGVATVFSAKSNSDASLLRNATRGPNGEIVGLTQRAAFTLNDQVAASTSIATGLFVGAGVLGVGGGALLVFGAPAERPE